MALKLHPDKNGNSETAKQQFQMVNEAYEVLSDENARKAYNMGGMQGVAMYRQVGNTIPPELIALGLGVGGCVLAFVVLLMGLFLIFLALKADGAVNWSWLIVWIPLWILDAIIVIGTFAIIKSYLSKDEDEEENPGDEAEKPKKDYAMIMKFGIQVWMWVVIQVLIALKLDDDVDYQWWVCVLPWIPAEIASYVFYFQKLGESNGDKMMKYAIFSQIRSTISFFLFIGFTCAKLDGAIDWDWAIVLLPYYGSWPLFPLIDYFFFNNLAQEMSQMARENHNDEMMAAAEQMAMQGSSQIVSCCGAGLCWVPFIVMLINYLNSWSAGTDGDLTLAVVMIPIYIFMAIFLALACCICMSLQVALSDSFDLDEDDGHHDMEKGDVRGGSDGDASADKDGNRVDSKANLLDANVGSDEETAADPKLAPQDTTPTGPAREVTYDDEEMD